MERVPHENIPSEFPDYEHWCRVRAGAVARSAGRRADAVGNGSGRGGARLQGRCHEGRQDEVSEIRSRPGLRGLHAVSGQEGLGLGPVRRIPRQAGIGEGLVQRIHEDGLTSAAASCDAAMWRKPQNARHRTMAGVFYA
ncbi:hypothetical protein BDI4_790020 [Burkholderia diffusa]|nr:hypothetical protein BDI4_790020 [Burkholderia diffusa]